MTDPNKPNFMDRSTILAFLIVLVFWFGWSKYMESRYPAQTAAATAQGTNQPAAPNQVGATTQQAPANAAATTAAAPAPTAETVAEQFVQYSDDTWEFQVSNYGMGLSGIHLKKYKTRDDQPIRFAEAKGESSFSTRLPPYQAPLVFTIERTAPDTFVGRAESAGTVVEKTLKVNSALYTVETTIKVTGTVKGVATRMADVVPPHVSSSIFAPNYDFLTWFVRHDQTNTRHVIDAEKGVQANDVNTSILGLSAHYFTLAVVDRSPLLPRFETNVPGNAPVAVGHLVYEPASALESLEIKYSAFAGPKDHDVLVKIDEHLTDVIDYGMFAFIGKPMLWLLKYIYSLIHNWGFAIIILTIIVRLLVMPFTVYSYKSMKVMQKLQPEMTRIREKYADKGPEQKMQMNQEIMDLMKRHKANPVGGCLPMLLQLPVFIALFAVLGQSIELYRAPFIFWIHDLSIKDPYYVLPVLMGITMFIQQKITPTTMDPQQAKIMMWMPVIFSFFMVSLPSGLTLYTFVSTLFGIVQQFVFMRDRTPTPTVKEAKA